ncbi:MAG: peptidoglycan D,D-transpeptidase FtsI family protein [Acidimicrobiia bacterium]
MLLALGVVVVRLVQVQLLAGDRYVAYGQSQIVRTVELPADRGSIFDRNGNDLALSRPRTTVWANPKLVEDPVATAAALAPVLGVDQAQLVSRLAAPDRAFAYLARRVDDEVAARVEELDLPGVSFLQEDERFRPSGDLARGLLGDVDIDNHGLWGIERQYDEMLAGASGELVLERDPDGRTIPGGERELEPASPGDDLVLTLDRSMQFETERALRDQILAKGAEGGVAIVSRPATGEILAMANMTTDPDTGEITSSGNNMALTAVYEPGSVNKVITLAAALEEGLVRPDTRITVPDHLQVSDHLFTDHDPHPTEDYSVTRILSDSSNIGTIKIAQMLGDDRVDAYLRRFGFGSTTGLGFPNEAAGIMQETGRWWGTDIGSIPIGQGISVTAMQMLAAYNVLANGGEYVPPRLVLATIDEQGVQHPVAAGEPRRVVSEDTAAQMREMLVNVVTEGTGTRGGITGYDVAGKTGTARKPQPNGGYHNEEGRYEYVATFTGFVPADRPELSIIVVIDEPSGDIYGGSVAAPVFADLAQYGLRLFRVPPPLVEQAPAPDTAAAQAQATGAVEQAGKVRATPAAAPTTTTVAPRGRATTTTTVAGGSGRAEPDG